MNRTAWFGMLALVSAPIVLGDAFADEGQDPVQAALPQYLAARRVAGYDPTAWVTSRHDEVAVFAGLARVDVTLAVANQGVTGLEWHRRIAVDPAADLIGAVYTRANGKTTAAQTLSSEDALRLYGRLTSPNYGRDPLRVDRPTRDALEVRIFPVLPGTSVRLVLSFVTPLSGRGSALTFRDPLSVRPSGSPEDRTVKPVTTPGLVAVSLAVPVARVAASTVLLRLADAVPAGLPAEGLASMTTTKDGFLLVPEEGEDLPDIDLKTLRGAPEATTIAAGGYPLFTSAFVWRVDPAAVAEQMGLSDRGGVTLRLSSVEGSTSRIAPEVLDASAQPTVVMGRAYSAEKLRVRVEAVDRSGTTVGKLDALVEAKPGRAVESVSDAVRAYHRARLAERVRRWAGSDAKRLVEATAYAVDLGVVGPGVSALAIPKDERGVMPRQDVSLYLTDGMPFDGDSTAGDLKPAPAGSVR